MDYPELALQVFGDPQQANVNGGGYGSCDLSTSIHPPEVSSCEELSAGDIQLVQVNSDDPDAIAMVGLEQLPAGLSILVTDKAWTGNGFRGYEGIQKYTTPEGGIDQGRVFGYGNSKLLGAATGCQSMGLYLCQSPATTCLSIT